jgi:membrane-associated phospholipid phosphatase
VTAPRVAAEPASGTVRREGPRWEIVIGAWLLALLVAVAVGMALKASGDWNRGLAWEHRLLEAFDDPLPLWLDTVMLIMPWFGTNFTLLPITIGSAAWLHWRKRRTDLALHLLVMQAGTLTLTMLVKAMLDRARPDLWTPRGQFAYASYPSGHLLASIAVLFTWAILLHRELGIRWPFLVATTILVVSAYSRLYLGVHWPSDLLGGALMGIVWLVGTLRAFRPRAVDHAGEAS